MPRASQGMPMSPEAVARVGFGYPRVSECPYVPSDTLVPHWDHYHYVALLDPIGSIFLIGDKKVEHPPRILGLL